MPSCQYSICDNCAYILVALTHWSREGVGYDGLEKGEYRHSILLGTFLHMVEDLVMLLVGKGRQTNKLHYVRAIGATGKELPNNNQQCTFS